VRWERGVRACGVIIHYNRQSDPLLRGKKEGVKQDDGVNQLLPCPSLSACGVVARLALTY